MASTSTTTTTEKKECPFKERCFRINPIHFQEMTHAHLEKLLMDQLETDAIDLPDHLPFECKSREDLMRQLKVLQMVMRKERKIAYTPQGPTSSEESAPKRPRMHEPQRNEMAERQRDRVRDEAIALMRAQGYEASLPEKGKFASKYAKAAPYHMFSSRVEKSRQTYNQDFSVTVSELLDRSLGEITNSLHFNFMIDVGWLCLQYLIAGQKSDMTVFLGERTDEGALPSKIKLVITKPPTAFGCHHSKLMVLQYRDGGIRIVVSTANLYPDDWENRTQCVWVSPHLMPVNATGTDDPETLGESPTGFKKSFLNYMKAYKDPNIVPWKEIIRKADFSSVNVFFVASIPGSHRAQDMEKWGHKRLSVVLSQHAVLPQATAKHWQIIAQSSSIGSLGKDYGAWLTTNIVASMSRDTNKGIKSLPSFKFIYPTVNNYRHSFDGRARSCCLPYSITTHSKQEWIVNYMCQWKSDKTHRSRAMPHVKSYTRISPDLNEIAWFVLTSANLSKAAWGNCSATSSNILNYEAGVVFLPKFITDNTTFPLTQEASTGAPVFQVPYDLPLTPYGQGDRPFVTESMLE